MDEIKFRHLPHKDGGYDSIRRRLLQAVKVEDRHIMRAMEFESRHA